MSTEKAPLHKFFVYAPDKPGAYEKRMEVRPQHLANAKQLADAKFIRTYLILFLCMPGSNMLH
jgi:uncharacterized protein YciI